MRKVGATAVGRWMTGELEGRDKEGKRSTSTPPSIPFNFSAVVARVAQSVSD